MYGLPLRNPNNLDKFPLRFQQVVKIVVACATAVALSDVNDHIASVSQQSVKSHRRVIRGPAQEQSPVRIQTRNTSIPALHVKELLSVVKVVVPACGRRQSVKSDYVHTASG